MIVLMQIVALSDCRAIASSVAPMSSVTVGAAGCSFVMGLPLRLVRLVKSMPIGVSAPTWR